MKTRQTAPRRTVRSGIQDESGLILIAALTLLTALILVGATAFIVSSTDVKVGGNFKTNQTALQVAMAGAEQARENLRALNAASAVSGDFSEELLSRVGANLVLNGYNSSTDDIAIASSNNLVSGYTYTAYLTNDSTDGASNVNDANAKVMITSVATGPNNAKAIVQTTVQLYSFSTNSPAVMYSKDNVTLNGSAIAVSGNDGSTCAGGNLAPIYTKDPATTTTNGTPVLSGSPSTPQHGTTDIDLEAYVAALKGGATYTLTEDVSGSTFGSATDFVTVYANAASTQEDGELRLNNVNGYGILLVDGDLQLAGNINWNGIIIVTGVITSTGGGSNTKNILGQIYSGSSSLGDSTISGSVVIGYHSCNVKKALSSQPLKVANWKQNY